MEPAWRQLAHCPTRLPMHAGAIGLGHLASRDLATWTVVAPALVPGRWGGAIGGVGKPAGNATGGYYSCSATLVNGTPRIVVPVVRLTHHPCAPSLTCSNQRQ